MPAALAVVIVVTAANDSRVTIVGSAQIMSGVNAPLRVNLPMA
jgi:hypothetical protein